MRGRTDNLLVEIQDGPEQIVLMIVGEIDASTVGDFEQELLSAIAGGKDCVVVDLSRVWFVDPSGMAAVMRALMHLAPHQELTLRAPGAAVRHQLEITALDTVISITG